MKRIRQILRWCVHQVLFYGYYRSQIGREALVHVSGMQLTVFPSVMNPVTFKTGKYFAAYLEGESLAGQSVLDMGTGSGVLALAAARQGARVTAVDVNPEAVRCASINASKNRLALEVIESDFFSGISTGKKFDLILFSPAYLKGVPENGLGRALFGGENLELLDSFFDNVSKYLTAQGRILMLLSSDADVSLIMQKAGSQGISCGQVEVRRGFFEDFLIYELRPVTTLR